MLICPECGSFDYKKTTGEEYPDPKEMLDMTAQHNKRTEGQQTNDMEEMWSREPRRIRVPQCVTCFATMLPRNPMAPHLRMPRAQYA